MAMTVAASSSVAVMIPRVSSTQCSTVPYLLPPLPPRSFGRSSFTVPLKLVSGNGLQKVELMKTRASSSDETSTSIDTNELFNDLKEKWDGLENKTTVVIYGGGAIVAVWLSSILVGAINSVPLLPKVMELVGLGYTGCVVVRLLYCCQLSSSSAMGLLFASISTLLSFGIICGFTTSTKTKGLEILAFPCNQGTTDPITDFVCIRFKSESPPPPFHKIEVNGENASPLYKFLKKGKCGDEIQWNFAKFLVDRQEWSSCRTSLLPKLLLFLHLSMILRSF